MNDHDTIFIFVFLSSLIMGCILGACTTIAAMNWKSFVREWKGLPYPIAVSVRPGILPCSFRDTLVDSGDEVTLPSIVPPQNWGEIGHEHD